jgi:rhodanese-related sulfurtransferase
MSLSQIKAEEALRLIGEGAVLVDVREADEHAREKVEGVRHLPLSRLEDMELGAPAGKPVIFHCRSGARTMAHGERLAQKAGGCEAFVVEGGFDALKRAGAPVVVDRRQPLELQRQVQIGAGALGLGGTLLGLFVAPGFFAIPAFVGAGLIFAGVTGFCGMARLLALAPWNAGMRKANT